MYKYVIKRILLMIPVLLGVILIIFVLNEISTGDPAMAVAGEMASEEDLENIREDMGLNKPIYVRFYEYVTGVVFRGDFGTSFMTKQPVSKEVFDRLPTTMVLASISMLFALIIGIPTGIISATRQYSWIDNVCTCLGLIGVSMPAFWHGLLDIMIFSIYLGWLPASGFYGPKYWILPAIAVGSGCAAQIMRMTRSSMLDVIRQDYIKAARAKGLTEHEIIFKHALKNALIPILTVIGMNFGILLGGSVLTETVFSIPGLGKYIVDAIKTRNYPVIQGGVLLLAIIFSFVMLIVDLLYAFVDPRLKSMYKTSSKKQKEVS